MKVRLPLITSLVFVLIGPIACTHVPETQPAVVPAQFTDADISPFDIVNTMPPFSTLVMEVLAHATKVEGRRLHARYIKGPDGKPLLEENIGPAITLEPALSAQLSEVLRDPKVYLPDVYFFCFEPGVQFDFYQGESHVIVLMCFNCENLKVKIIDRQGMKITEDITFSPGYARLARIAKEVFPDDKEVQSIDENAGMKLLENLKAGGK